MGFPVTKDDDEKGLSGSVAAQLRREDFGIASLYEWTKTVIGGHPIIGKTSRNHNFSTEISQVILATMVLAPNFCCKNSM